MAQKLILIGASTGGPGHIKKLLKDVKLNGATVVIAQHMNKMFIGSLAPPGGEAGAGAGRVVGNPRRENRSV